jgi:RNase H-like domain found in reverse transcriptase/Integrase zinc binding domain
MYILESDASAAAYRSVLLQEFPDGQFPVGFFLGKFSSAELNYTLLERELLLILLALLQWSYLLEGATHEILVRTDYKNFQAIKSLPITSEKHMRWMHQLSRYQLKLTYYAGTKNIMADTLSRPEGPPAKRIFEGKIWQLPAICYTESNAREATPRRIDKRSWLWLAHDHPRSGHRGIAANYLLFRRYTNWEGMLRDVRDYVKTCVACQVSKPVCTALQGLLLPIPVPKYPGEFLSLDLLSGLPKVLNQSLTVLVTTDRFSGMLFLNAYNGTVDSETIFEYLKTKCMNTFGYLPKKVLSDRGPQFISAEWVADCKESRITPQRHPLTIRKKTDWWRG